MNASLQALLAIPEVRAAVEAVPLGDTGARSEWRFADRGSAAQRARSEPDFDALLAQTLREMESGRREKAVALQTLPEAFYDGSQQDAGEFMRELLHLERAPSVSALFRMEKAERLACAREGCDGVTAILAEKTFTCLTVHASAHQHGGVATLQDAVDESCGGEIMESDFRWTCPRGDCDYKKARKEWELERVPQCLWVQLLSQRYDQNAGRVVEDPE